MVKGVVVIEVTVRWLGLRRRKMWFGEFGVVSRLFTKVVAVLTAAPTMFRAVGWEDGR